MQAESARARWQEVRGLFQSDDDASANFRKSSDLITQKGNCFSGAIDISGVGIRIVNHAEWRAHLVARLKREYEAARRRLGLAAD